MESIITIRSLFRTTWTFIALGAMLPRPALAQLNIAATNTPYTITFDATIAGVNNGTFAGSGFAPSPAIGQLNSNAWASTGMSAGASTFGGTNTSDDFARGTVAGGTTSGGFYAFTAANIGSSSLGIKPGGSDWTPGTLTLRVQNTTGANLTSLDVGYELWNNNSQERSNSFNFSWSTDDATYTAVAALDFTSPAGSDMGGYVVSNKSTSITGLGVANNGYIYLRWSGDDATGSGSRDEFALDDISVTGHGGSVLNTSVQFASTASSVTENAGPTELELSISNFDVANATSVTISASGATGRITSFTTPVNFPANSGADQNVTVALDNNTVCNGDEDVLFTITGISGGQGMAYIGANESHTLTVQDDEAPANPVTTAGTAVASDGFTANWNAVNGATNYYLDVYTATASVEEDFNDGNFTASPAWSGGLADHSVLTDATLPNGNATTDLSFLGSNASVGGSAVLMPSAETAEWKFSLGSGNFNPSATNNFGVVLMSDAAISAIADDFNGYYLLIGTGGSTDGIELWSSAGATKTQVGTFPSSPVVGSGALQDGLDIRVTRSGTGEFELLYAAGFTYAATPITSAGTLTDNTYGASNFFGVYTDFANPSAARRVYIDNIVLGGSAAYVPGYDNFDASTSTSAVITGLASLTTYHYRVHSAGGCSSGEISNVTDVTTLAGVNPALSVGSLEDFGALCLGAEGGPNSFTVQGFNLSTADVTVAALDGFSYSTSELGTYTSALSISQPGGSFTQDLWMKFTPTLEQSYSGNITVGGGGASSVDVAVTGSGINTSATMTTGSALSVATDQAELAGTIDDQGCSALTEYGIEYSSMENFIPGTGTPVGSTNESGGAFSSVLSGLTPCTTYYYVAYGTNNGGTTYGAQDSFVTSPITAPVASVPVTINTNDFTATWEAVAGATGYRLDVSTSPTFGSTIMASDLFFSEYVEGGSNNKYVEVYNGTGSSVDLSQYALQLFANGAPSATVSDTLSGTLANGATIVYAHGSAAVYLGTVVVSGAVNFNGDDAFALRNVATNSYADIIGSIDEDPGSAWTGTGGRSTVNKTLVRNADVHGGVTTNPVTGFPSLDGEWSVYNQDDVSRLGAHDFDNLAPYFLPGYEDLSVLATSQSVTGLDASTTYYFRVRAENSSCASGNSNTIPVSTLACAGNAFVVSILTDAHGDQTTWEVVDENNASIATGGPYPGQNNTLVNETVCIGSTPMSACYGFHLYDSFGDGLSGNGNWKLRTMDGRLLLGDAFPTGYQSPASPSATAGYGTDHGFCLPPGPSNIAAHECGVFNNALGNKVYSTSVPGATQYEFEFSDPDAGFVRRINTTHNYVHFGDMVNPGLTPGVRYFTRVRTNVAGPLASAHFGAGCHTGLSVPAVVRCSQLINSPAYGHSCNETRAFGTTSSFIYAKPVTGADQYQFRVFNTQEGYDQVFSRSTYILALKWNASVAPPLMNGSTYNVEINVRVNGLYSGFCPSTCAITIDNPTSGRPEARMSRTHFGEATMWPNPVRDGQVNLNISELQDADQQITVAIQDVLGKRVFAKDYGNNGDRFTTILYLPSDITSGIYVVNIIVNGETTVQRLSIIK